MVHISRCQVVERLVIAVIVIVIYELLDLSIQLARQVIVLQVNHVLDRPMITLNLTLGLGMVPCTPGMLHLSILEIFLQFP